jgi:hypothetical protein
MLYKTLSAAVYGIDASIIEVEVDVSGIKTNEDHFHTVGLPDAAVRESRDRVRAALKNCGYDIPSTHITINLAPADIKKEGSGFDLPMALGILGDVRDVGEHLRELPLKDFLDCAPAKVAECLRPEDERRNDLIDFGERPVRREVHARLQHALALQRDALPHRNPLRDAVVFVRDAVLRSDVRSHAEHVVEVLRVAPVVVLNQHALETHLGTR